MRDILLFFGVDEVPPVENASVEERKGNVLLNDALSTFYLRLYGVRHMVKDPSVEGADSEDCISY